MKINITPLSQRDPRWAGQRLGTVDGTTIGGFGCLVTCMSMLATYYGHTITPDVMDNWLTDNQGYVQGNLYRNDAFGREFSDCSFDTVIFCTNIPAPLSEIDVYLQAKKPVVVMVDFDHDPANGVQTHFVLVTGKTEDGQYIINDPWFGDEVFLDARYGEPAKAINQVNFFSGPIPPKPIEPLPNYLKSLLQEKNLDINNESLMRQIIQNGLSYSVLYIDKNNMEMELNKLKSELKDALTANKIQADVISQLRQDLNTCLNKKDQTIQPTQSPDQFAIVDTIFDFISKLFKK